ncbi:MAG: phosphoglucosamine mutase [Verrucomicrobiota bacterium]
MMNRKYFGTDGIRGTYGHHPMTSAFAYQVGYALGKFFNQEESTLFVIGRDTRASGTTLEKALVKGIEKSGGSAACIGVIPTAAVALLTQHHRAAAGIMISASHNPYEDNGIKCFGQDGFKLTDEIEREIETLIDQAPALQDSQLTDQKPCFETKDTCFKIYEKALCSSLPEKTSLEGLNIFVDCGNGASWVSTPQILKNLGAKVTSLFVDPNGENINLNCGSQHTAILQELVKKNEYAVGLAHDGDADRFILIDETGQALDGDEVLAILGIDMLERRTLKHNTVVTTVMSNLALDEVLMKHGGHVHRTQVGDRYVLAAMKEHDYNLGGEQSGHMILLDFLSTGDGLLSALQVLELMTRKKKTLTELRTCIKKYPQQLFNIRVKSKPPLEELTDLQLALNEVNQDLGAQGRAFLRYSGTENKIRLLLEAKDASKVSPMAERILKEIRIAIGV